MLDLLIQRWLLSMILKNNLQLKMKILLLMVVDIFKRKFNEFNKNCSQFIISTENVFKCLKLIVVFTVYYKKNSYFKRL